MKGQGAAQASRRGSSPGEGRKQEEEEMSLPRPQPDHRSVWTKQRQLCLGGGNQRGTNKRGPPPVWKPPSSHPSWHGAFPTLTLTAAPSPLSPNLHCVRSTTHTGDRRWMDREHKKRVCEATAIPPPIPQFCLNPETAGFNPRATAGPTSPLSASISPWGPRLQGSWERPPPPLPQDILLALTPDQA